MIAALLNYYAKEPGHLSRVLDVAQELKALTQILETKPYGFSIDLAALASRRDYLNLEKWLHDHVKESGEIFVRATLEFLREKCRAQILKGQGAEGATASVPLSPDVAAMFLKVLNAQPTVVSPETSTLIKEVVSLTLQSYPRLTAVNASSEDGPTSQESFPPDVEEEANSYYEKIYKGETSIEAIVSVLQRLKASQVKRDQDIFNCMIHSLFDEYKFFSRYPDKELAITSMLFGALIQHQIVSYMPLGIALRYVLDALRQPVGSKLFKFGIGALRQFQSRLNEWPQYCAHLVSIVNLQTSHPEIVAYIQQCQQGKNVMEAATEKGLTDSSIMLAKDVNSQQQPLKVVVSSAPVFRALRVGAFHEGLDSSAEEPDEKTQDKILFLINNLSEDNLDQKFVEMRALLHELHYRWFSNYIVIKRASIEPNFHGLYIAFLNRMNSSVLNKQVVHFTLENLRVLLNSEKTVSSSSERALLKNLATWLGALTLGKDKPIKHKNIAFKVFFYLLRHKPRPKY